MGFHHRKFLTELCELICHGKESVSNCSSNNKDCNAVCFKICLPNPQYPFFNHPPPPSPPQQVPSFVISDENNNHRLTNYFILTLSLVAFIFFLVCIRAICISFRSRRRRRLLAVTRASASSAPSSTVQQIDENFDENQHVVDHPIWYIRTLGLNQSVINTISVCKYKKGEGLIEGTDCSVCLSEFEEDENLRLLPKCNHAFHLPCIDTWLRSHTNCPMCRAPIVSTNPEIGRVESMEPVIVVDSSSGSLEHTQIEVFEENSGDGETNLGFGSCDFDSESRNRVAAEEEEEGEGQLGVCENERRVSVVRPRRSLSMDDSFVANINNALANVLSIEESKGNGESSGVICNDDTICKVNGNENLATTSKGSSSFSFRSTRYLQGVPSPMKRSSSYNGKFLLSWYGRTQKKPNAILRNF